MAWDMYFSAIIAMQEHPGMNRENAVRKSMPECAEAATQALLARREAIRCLGQ